MEREALKLALEAAEIGLANLTSYQSAPIGPSIHEYGQAVHALIEVREAKKALAQPESEIKSWGETHPRNPSAACSCEHWQSCVECRPTAHAQPAQEPVAWVNIGNLQGLTLGHYSHVEIYTDESAGRTPLYTAPPQREWVGLTEEETTGFTSHEMTVVKYVSKVLQEKNHG